MHSRNLPSAEQERTSSGWGSMSLMQPMPLGTVLFWGGHEMIYLGQDNGKLYVISATGSIGNLFADSGTTQIKGVVITIARRNNL